MAGGYPVTISGHRIPSVEALYQACRYPHLPDAQEAIIQESSPIIAKRVSRRFDRQSRPDWSTSRISVMRWALRVKLVQNWVEFSALLRHTKGRPIVEESHRDVFWGARPTGEGTLRGRNALGRLLMELREQVLAGEISRATTVPPPAIPDFMLFGRPVPPLSRSSSLWAPASEGEGALSHAQGDADQLSLLKGIRETE